jgi:hypothetical protein
MNLRNKWLLIGLFFLVAGCSAVPRQCKSSARVVVRGHGVDVYCDDALAVTLSGPVTRDGF